MFICTFECVTREGYHAFAWKTDLLIFVAVTLCITGYTAVPAPRRSTKILANPMCFLPVKEYITEDPFSFTLIVCVAYAPTSMAPLIISIHLEKT